jgi:glycine cleavage system H protein
MLNQDPHGKGWIIRLRLKNKGDFETLMTAVEYEKFLEGLAS